MNWKQINEKYPKAFELWFEQSGCHLLINEFLEDEDAIEDWPLWIDRELYDFFDKQGVYIDISVSLSAKNAGAKFIWPRIMYWNKEGLRVHVCCGEYEDRKEAETYAFEQCFKELETLSL